MSRNKKSDDLLAPLPYAKLRILLLIIPFLGSLVLAAYVYPPRLRVSGAWFTIYKEIPVDAWRKMARGNLNGFAYMKVENNRATDVMQLPYRHFLRDDSVDAGARPAAIPGTKNFFSQPDFKAALRKLKKKQPPPRPWTEILFNVELTNGGKFPTPMTVDVTTEGTPAQYKGEAVAPVTTVIEAGEKKITSLAIFLSATEPLPLVKTISVDVHYHFFFVPLSRHFEIRWDTRDGTLLF